LNAVAELETDLGPYQLLIELQGIESALGRVRSVVNGPRTIDLDILTYEDVCMREEALCIPHPRMLEREFVLVPLRQIAPEAIALAKKLLAGGKQTARHQHNRRAVIKRKDKLNISRQKNLLYTPVPGPGKPGAGAENSNICA